MDSAEPDLIDIVPMTSHKAARPKSAVRRHTIDRDLDMIEGLDFNAEEDLEDVPFEYQDDGKYRNFWDI